MALTDKLKSIADSIRSKTGKTDTMTLDQMVTEIQAIRAGGSGMSGAVSLKDVNFYDYDGTLLYTYTLDEAHSLTELPDGTEHAGLMFDGWNLALEKVQSLTRPMNIGAMYSTDDGTTRIYIRLKDGRTSPMLGICPNGTVTVDWGDGTDPDVLTGTSLTTVLWTPTHNYSSPGDYVIRLTVDGSAQLYGNNSGSDLSYILRYSSGSDNRNYIYNKSVQKVEIGDSVSIGNHAFNGCSSLSSVTIPDGVTSIGTYAFRYCSSLSSIVIPDGVISIDTYAFYKCSSLSSVTIPDGVTSIGTYAFNSCSSLSSVTIPDGVTSIGTYAFSGCTSLSSIVIPDGVISIDSYTFSSCYSLSSVTIPDGVTSIGSSTFDSCSSLSSIVIPDGLTSIGSFAFSNCTSMSSIVIPDGVTNIGTYAFRYCYSLSSVTIPDGVTSIGSSTFGYCYAMKYYDFTRHTAVPTLSSTNAFDGIAADCEIRVPAALSNEWKAATNWATYADRIVGV